MSKLLTEMHTILGKQVSIPGYTPERTPGEVVGTFAVTEPGLSPLDESMLESIAELDWDSVFDIALLASVGADGFSRLVSSYGESTTGFRDAWNALIEDGDIADDMRRGSFVLLANACQQTESMPAYVAWCVRAVQESDEKTKKKARKKSSRFGEIIPAGSSAEHARGVDDAISYLTPHKSGTDRPSASAEVMKNDVFKSDKSKEVDGMAKVVKAEKMMKKIADAKGMKIDQAFPNLFRDLARERVRNS